MQTKIDIDYTCAPGGFVATIPAGTVVFPADNLPQGGYWCGPWPGMDEQAESWMHNYGFFVSKDQVVKSVFVLQDKNTFAQINAGDEVGSFQGEKYIVVGFRAPHKPSSTGHVFLRRVDAGEDEMDRSFFPGVINAEIVTT